MKTCRDNDRIIVHNGQYQPDEWQEYCVDKMVQIIGIGHESAFKCNKGIKITKNAYFENITFYFKGFSSLIRTTMSVDSGCKLWMKNCKFLNVHKAIKVDSGADFIANGCSFISVARGIDVLTDSGNVTIEDCIFKDCGDNDILACIAVRDGIGHKNLNLRCKRNIFEGNKWYPFINFSDVNDKNKKIVLEDNVIKGEGYEFGVTLFAMDTLSAITSKSIISPNIWKVP